MTHTIDFPKATAEAKAKLSDLRATLRATKDPTVKATLRQAIAYNVLLLNGLRTLHDLIKP